MARTRAANFEQQRDAMLAAAARLFAERGYPAASIADLAAQCGVSKGLLYHYYRDKEHLLFDIADRYVDRLVQLIAEVEQGNAAPEMALRHLIERVMIAYEHAGDFHRVLVQDVKYLSAVHRARVRTKQRVVIDAFAAAIAATAPELAGDRLLKPVTMTLFGMMNWTFTWLRPDGPVAHAELAPVVADLFLGGVRRLHATGAARMRTRNSSTRAGRVPELAR
ncbi:MAG TPA: TetR/AcrR family transcriptional regulator [Burkholderiaceae bacterium]|nr:TetR/AcrR family transcriptional regulator [Burkholderiaceae bacterium]